MFEIDPFPKKPKILFIGIPYSTHTLGWIDLLSDAEMNVRLFCVHDGYPPSEFKVRTYLTTKYPPADLDLNTRQSWFPIPEEWWKQEKEELKRQKESGFLNRAKNKFVLSAPAMPSPLTPRTPSPEMWLAQIIRDWKPDIIHTLGLDPASYYYFDALNQYKLSGIAQWVLQLRGGSDLTLSHLDPDVSPRIASVLQRCDYLVSDNKINFRYALKLGVKEEKFASVSPVPGSGGVNVKTLADSWNGNPSQRRVILWPKSYDCTWSKSLQVLEAIKLVWEKIKPCTFYMLAMNTETRSWYYTLPEEILQNCRIYEGIPREQTLSLMTQARVMLSPSLVDGVPNCLYEAMAAGAFPIVSPLETITPIVKNVQNVLFARNLYPFEIADALSRAMNDNNLVNKAAKCNLELVRQIADRTVIAPKIIDFYNKISISTETVRAAQE